MSHTPHELAAEFPDKRDEIHRLKLSDGEFQRLADDYHQVNRAIHRAESLVEPTDAFHEQRLRKERMVLKDRISAKLSQAVAR